jgi:hypothetical protein
LDAYILFSLAVSPSQTAAYDALLDSSYVAWICTPKYLKLETTCIPVALATSCKNIGSVFIPSIAVFSRDPVNPIFHCPGLIGPWMFSRLITENNIMAKNLK